MSEIISADCHLDFWYLPGDLFVSEAPASWKERMPRVENTDSGRAWVHKGKIIRYVGDVGLGRGAFDSIARPCPCVCAERRAPDFIPTRPTACSGRHRQNTASKIKSATASARR